MVYVLQWSNGVQSFWFYLLIFLVLVIIYLQLLDKRLADGNVHCAGSATYQICFRLPIPNRNPNPKP